jgi:TatD-related deoxyribonuclease
MFDNHFHLRSDGRGVAAVEEFLKAGGTHLLLTHAPHPDIPVRGAADYAIAYDRTLRLAEAVRRETTAGVFVALGPYPVELVHLTEHSGLPAAKETLMAGMEVAASLVREGRAIALGEIGRPHFPVPPELLAASNEVLERGMALAREAGCAVILHAEDPTEATFREWTAMAARAGLPAEKVVKHHATPIVAAGERTGVWPSLLAREDVVTAAVAEGTRFLLETDYMDDPRRPGAVLGPATVPRKTRLWRERGLLSEEAVHRIHEDNPRRVYGIDL